MKFFNKVVFITGATGQLGKAYAIAMAEEGAHVCISDIDLNACNELRLELKGDEHLAIECDVTSEVSVRSAFAKIEEHFKQIDIIINNAGIGVFTPFEERSFEEFMRVFEVNAGGTFLCIKEGSALMRKNKSSGVIVNIGSIYGVVSSDPRIYTDCARKTAECYGGSKAAIIQMTRYFAVHLAPYNIRVNCLSPGGVYNHQGDDFVKNYSDKTPVTRMGTTTDMVGALKFLCSDEAQYTTGHNLVVDGGWTAW
jgi:3-oxoacyl-[acyl-carrier protein] reductase